MESKKRGWSRWLPLALLVLAGIFGAKHFHEVKKAAALLGHAHLEWIALALLFQVGTYFAVGFVYRTLARALKTSLPWPAAAKLAVVNLFVNAAVPSAGLSGNLFLGRMLSRRGVPAGTGSVIVLLERTVYFTALAMFAAVVIGIRVMHGRLRPSEVIAAAALSAVVVGLILTARKVLRSPRAIAERIGGWAERAPRWIAKRISRPALLAEAKEIEDAGGPSALPASVLALALVAEGTLLLLDSLTIWALFHAIKAPLPLGRASVGFALATVLAQIVVIPGTLEVGLAGILRGVGAHIGSAVAVTLLFHVVTFWLPLPLGWLFYRNAEAGAETTGRRPSDSIPSARPTPRSESAADPSP